jgi:hypothetical protein
MAPIKRPFQVFDGIRFYLNETGYYYTIINGKHVKLHRYVWTKQKGTIPADHDIHHKDGDKANNGISNLEPITRSDHLKLHHANRRELTTHCKHGHEWTPENTYQSTEGRMCKTCVRLRARAWRSKTG